jgi:hypothetical protein
MVSLAWRGLAALALLVQGMALGLVLAALVAARLALASKEPAAPPVGLV